ncbi:MAG: GMC oxidoreductase [Anaerolineales bacterium]|jgi:cholesterol oxidase|nr:GMC oxidoreductase [Anaerolineales bacterium]
MTEKVYDYVIIGSGFGGSVSALRLAEKGYSVLVLEKGKRFRDQDFAKTNWQYWKYLWLPALRAFGVLQISILKGVMVLHGAGVGGGSLGYANVLEVPTAATFATPAWNTPINWGKTLQPHYETARRMLGAARNPKLWKADEILREMAVEMGTQASFRATEVGAYFGESGKTVPDPYFDGAGPERAGCQHCGGCMVGCRHNAKNTLPKNYLYFAEKLGVEVLPESEVSDVRPCNPSILNVQPATSCYQVTFQRSTSFFKRKQAVLAKRVIFSAGVIGTMNLLLRLRDVQKSLPSLSARLGDVVRTNSEALLGGLARKSDINYSEGVSISSIFNVDEMTRVEPVRYPDGSSLMRFLAAPLIDVDGPVAIRVLRFLGWILSHPLDFARAAFLPGWAHNTTILLVMQHADNRMRFRMGRSLFTLFRTGLVAQEEPGYEIQAQVAGSHALTREFARRVNGVSLGSIGENLLGLPTTAHILGGAPIGGNALEGLVDENFEIHNYPGLFVIDGSIMPANPGVNPSLTIAALAEYAISKVSKK